MVFIGLEAQAVRVVAGAQAEGSAQVAAHQLLVVARADGGHHRRVHQPLVRLALLRRHVLLHTNTTLSQLLNCTQQATTAGITTNLANKVFS